MLCLLIVTPVKFIFKYFYSRRYSDCVCRYCWPKVLVPIFFVNFLLIHNSLKKIQITDFPLTLIIRSQFIFPVTDWDQ